jgi:hypothetical protein
MKTVLTLLLFLFSFCVFGQDVSGTWEGEFSSDLVFPLRRSFFMHMEIQQSGREVRAVFFNAPLHDITHPGVMYRVSGRYDKKKKRLFPLNLYRDGIIQNNIGGVAEAFISLTTWWLKNDTAQLLYGTWEPSQRSPRSDGAGGVFWLRKVDDTISAYAARMLLQKGKKVQKNIHPADTVLPNIPRSNMVKNYSQRQQHIYDTVTVPSENVFIELYDNAETDGDSISVYVDDKPILVQQQLSTKPIIANITLAPGRNHTISLFAHNLGAIPPNTALMVISSGSLRKYIFLSADYDANAAVVLQLKE